MLYDHRPIECLRARSLKGKIVAYDGTKEPDWKLLRDKIECLLEFEVQNYPDGKVIKL